MESQEETGFCLGRIAEFGRSDVIALRGLETRKDSLLICEAKR